MYYFQKILLYFQYWKFYKFILFNFAALLEVHLWHIDTWSIYITWNLSVYCHVYSIVSFLAMKRLQLTFKHLFVSFVSLCVLLCLLWLFSVMLLRLNVLVQLFLPSFWLLLYKVIINSGWRQTLYLIITFRVNKLIVCLFVYLTQIVCLSYSCQSIIVHVQVKWWHWVNHDELILQITHIRNRLRWGRWRWNILFTFLSLCTQLLICLSFICLCFIL